MKAKYLHYYLYMDYFDEYTSFGLYEYKDGMFGKRAQQICIREGALADALAFDSDSKRFELGDAVRETLEF